MQLDFYIVTFQISTVPVTNAVPWLCQQFSKTMRFVACEKCTVVLCVLPAC